MPTRTVLGLVLLGWVLLSACTEPDRTAHDAACGGFCAQYPPPAALTLGCVCENGKPQRSASGFPYVSESAQGFCVDATNCATRYGDDALGHTVCEALRARCERTPGIGDTE